MVYRYLRAWAAVNPMEKLTSLTSWLLLTLCWIEKIVAMIIMAANHSSASKVFVCLASLD